jgi:hypothetical protein
MKEKVFFKNMIESYNSIEEFKYDIKNYIKINYPVLNGENMNVILEDLSDFKRGIKYMNTITKFLPVYQTKSLINFFNPKLKKTNLKYFLFRQRIHDDWEIIVKEILSEMISFNERLKNEQNKETVINNFQQINQNILIQNEVNKIFINKTVINNNHNFDLKYTYNSNSYKNEIDNSINVKYRYFYDKANPNSFICENDFLIIEEIINEISKEFTLSKDILEYKGKKSNLIHKLIRFILFDELPNINSIDKIIIPRGMYEYEGLILLYLWEKSRKIKECDKDVFFMFYKYFIDFNGRSENVESQLKYRKSAINHFIHLKDSIIKGDIQNIISAIKENQDHKLGLKEKKKKSKKTNKE